MMLQMVTPSSDTLTVRPWPDEELDRAGHDPRSAYVERFWLPMIGPSATWLLRRFAAGFDAAPEGFTLSLGDAAREIGLGDKSGRHTPLLRTLSRIMQFDLLYQSGPDDVAVRRRLPTLSRRQAARLSPALQDAHGRWQSDQLKQPPEEAERRRCMQLALSLVELGDDAEAVERQLLRWRYHPTLAREASSWASEVHRSMVAAEAG